MKLISRSCLLAIAVLTTLMGTAQAQIIWGPMQTITGDSDISTNGTYVDAINTIMNGSFTTTTVGTTTFHALTAGTDGIITDVATIADGNFNSTGYTGGTANYEYIINNATDVTTATVTIADLVAGRQYQVQVWGYWPGPYNADLEGTYAGGGTPVVIPPYTGGYTIGTFTAAADTFSFNYYQDHPSNGGFVNDIAVRDITATPEPSTYALMLGGLGLLAFWRLRTRRTLSDSPGLLP